MKKQVGRIFIEQRGWEELAVCVVNSLGRIMTDDPRTPKTLCIDRAGYFFSPGGATYAVQTLSVVGRNT